MYIEYFIYNHNIYINIIGLSRKTLNKYFINRSHYATPIEIDMESPPSCSFFHIKHRKQKTRKQIRDFGAL